MPKETTDDGTATEPSAGITVAQLEAQLSKKASPDAGGQPAAPDLAAAPSGEAPGGSAAGTESDLFQNASGQPAGGEQATEQPATRGGDEDNLPAAPEWYEKRVAKFR